MKTIVLGSDHGAIELRVAIKEHLELQGGYKVIDIGTHTSESVDYPDIADTVVREVLKESHAVGVLCCGTGIGISIRANRNKGIRAALVYNEFTAEMAKAHNNANILCLGGRTTAIDLALKLVDIWLKTAYQGGRHDNRVCKLDL